MVSEIAFQGEDTPLTRSASALAWSPDGTHIVALTHGQLQIVQVGASLTSYALDEPNDGGKLAWSPDSRYLAVAVNEPDNLLSFGSRLDVWDIIARRQVRVLNGNAFPPSFPNALAWSRDGKFIRIIANVYQQENWNWP
jgi:WD40 repeat protein